MKIYQKHALTVQSDQLRKGTLDSACKVITDYIHVCVESILLTKTVKVYPNNNLV